MADAHVDRPHQIGSVEGELYVRIHSAGVVQLGDPVELGPDAEWFERLEEDRAHEVASVVGRGAAFWCRHTREWRSHVAVDRVRGQQRLRVHGVHVVDAVQEARLPAGAQQSPIDRIVKDDAAQGADVDRPRG